MKSKGFTLIELLGVIIILALLMLIVLPNVINSVKSSSVKVDEITKKLVFNATDLYIDSNKNSFEKKEGVSYCVDFSDLVDSGYLKSPITSSDNSQDLTDLKSVQITYKNNKFNYEVVDKDDCVETTPSICTLSTETYNRSDFVTPDIIISDTIEVLTCGSEQFYVMEKTDTTMKALAKYNLGLSTSPYLQDTSGATNSITFWESSPEVWPEAGSNAYYYGDDTDNLIRPYVNEYKNYLINEFEMNGIVARLMTYSEAKYFGFSEDYSSYKIFPDELYSPNYYLATFISGDEYSSYFYGLTEYGIYGSASPFNWGQSWGIRPLIIVPLNGQIIIEPEIIPIPTPETSGGTSGETCMADEEFVENYLQNASYDYDLRYSSWDGFGYRYYLNTLPTGIEEIYNEYYNFSVSDTTESCAYWRDAFIENLNSYLNENEEDKAYLNSVFNHLYGVFTVDGWVKCSDLGPIIVFDFPSCDSAGIFTNDFKNANFGLSVSGLW